LRATGTSTLKVRRVRGRLVLSGGTLSRVVSTSRAWRMLLALVISSSYSSSYSASSLAEASPPNIGTPPDARVSSNSFMSDIFNPTKKSIYELMAVSENKDSRNHYKSAQCDDMWKRKTKIGMIID